MVQRGRPKGFKVKRKNLEHKSSDLWKLIREKKCKDASHVCGIFDGCQIRGLTELCPRWLNPQEYYDVGEDWRKSVVAKLVRPHGVTEGGWIYYCEGCMTEFEMAREIHVPLCISCREQEIRRIVGDAAFKVPPRTSRKIGGAVRSGDIAILDEDEMRSGGVGGVEGEGERNT